MKGNVEILASPSALESRAAEVIVKMINEAIESRGRATFALSGGSTPRHMYEELGSRKRAGEVDWKRVHLFWGDERCVPPTSTESNYRMAKESLLANVKIPESNVHRVMTEMPPRQAALQYEQTIRQLFGLSANALPSFDIVLLGLGDDGHTASLFPSSPVLQERTRLAVEVFVEKKAQYRVTLTLPVLNNAANVLFIVSGPEKANILREVFEVDASGYPAQSVCPVSGRLYWLVDKAAAAKLHTMNKQ